MHGIRKILALGATAALLATAAPEMPQKAEAGLPAPIPTQIPIRDIASPPTPNTPATPFVPRSAPSKRRRVKKPRKRPVAHRRAKAKAKPVATSGNPAQPKLEQRYEAPTQSLFIPPEPAPAKGPATGAAPAGPSPAPAQFPPEPAPAASPGGPSAPPVMPAPASTPGPATTPGPTAAPAAAAGANPAAAPAAAPAK